MFKGSVYCRKWEHEGKKRKAWGIRYSVNGGPVKREIVAGTREAAQTELDKKREDYQRRLLGVAEGKTLKDLLPLFLTHKENQEKDMETLHSRLNNLLPFFGAFPLEDIDAEAIDRYVARRKAEYKVQPCKGHAPGERCGECDQRITTATINRDISVLRSMLRLAVRKWKWLRQEPYFEKLPESGPRDFELTEAEEVAVLPNCSPELTAIIGAAIHTGMRQGEILSLTWGQVDLSNRTLDFEPTKRGRKRLVPIAEPLYYTLVRLRDVQARSGRLKPTARVFLRPDGLPWTPYTLLTHYQKALAAAGITTPLTWHDLRHTTASRMKRGGVHETEIQRLLGHKTLSMTDRYINVEVEQLRAAVAVLSKPSTKEAQECEVSEILVGNSLK
jgi:integrase